MSWQQRIHVATGLSCGQIVLHLLVLAVLIIGWLSGALVPVALGICILYVATLLAMLFLQFHRDGERWRDTVDLLEELTTAWYVAVMLIMLWLLSHVLHSHLLLAIVGLVTLTG